MSRDRDCEPMTVRTLHPFRVYQLVGLHVCQQIHRILARQDLLTLDTLLCDTLRRSTSYCFKQIFII